LINYTTNAAATFRLIAPQCLVKGHVQFVRVASVGELRGGGGNCFIALWPITFKRWTNYETSWVDHGDKWWQMYCY